MKTYIILVSLILFACSKNKVQEIDLYSTLSSYEINKEIILAGVSSIDWQNNNFIITEYDYNRLYSLSKDFQLHNSFDNLGLLYPSYPNFAKFNNNSVWVYSAEKRKIFQYSANEVISEHEIVSDTDLINFDTNGDELIYSRVDFEEEPFVLIDLKTGNMKRFGEYLEDMPNTFLNHYMLNSFSFIREDSYFFVQPYNGMISEYDKNFQLKNRINILDFPQFSIVKEYFSTFFKSKNNSLVSLISDAKLIDDKLYLLIYERNPELPPNPRTLLRLDLENGIVLETIIKLGGEDDYFTKFCNVEGNKFAFYEYQTSSIQFFEIPLDK
jgi:hypothetical protein